MDIEFYLFIPDTEGDFLYYTRLLEFLSEVQINEPEIIKLGLKTYAEQNFDFVDCILYAYSKVKGYEIQTFDKKLKKFLEKKVL